MEALKDGMKLSKIYQGGIAMGKAKGRLPSRSFYLRIGYY